MQLDIFSDVVCPWCYLGHRRLESAIQRLAPRGRGIELRWRAFQLDPGATAEPKDLRQSLERKYGPGAFDAMTERLGVLGAEAGIDYRFDRALRVGTFDAHRLMQWVQATRTELTAPLAERLFRAYFTEGSNIADRDLLANLAVEVGLDREAAAELLASDGFAEIVRADIAEAVESGVTGVPAVAYNGTVLIPGAQDVETMQAVLERLLDKVG